MGTMLKLAEKMIVSIIPLGCLARQEEQMEGTLVPLQRPGDCTQDRDRRKGALLTVKIYWKHANMHVE